METPVPAGQTPPNTLLEDIPRGYELWRKLYRKAYEDVQPNTRGVRSTLTDCVEQPFQEGFLQIFPEYDNTHSIPELKGRLSKDTLQLSSWLEGQVGNPDSIARHMSYLGWTQIQLVCTQYRTGVQTWYFRTTFIANPDQLDAEPMAPETENVLPLPTHQPLRALEAWRVFNCLLEAAIKCDNREFVEDPVPILRDYLRSFRETYCRTRNTLNQLMDAGLVERRHEAPNVSKRVYLHEPKTIPPKVTPPGKELPDSLEECIIRIVKEVTKEIVSLDNEERRASLHKRLDSLNDALHEVRAIRADRDRLHGREAAIVERLNNE